MDAEAMKRRAGELLPHAQLESENLTGLAADYPTPYNVNRAADANDLAAILRAVAAGEVSEVSAMEIGLGVPVDGRHSYGASLLVIGAQGGEDG